MVRSIVVMGVSGSGKTTIGRRLAGELGFAFCDADDFHSPENVAKMRRGVSLSDEDRLPWLRSLRARLDTARERGEPMVLACSALKAMYRDELGVPGAGAALVYLRATRRLIEARLRDRTDHFMPMSLVVSQLTTLEEPDVAVVVDASQPLETILRDIRCALGLS